MELRTLRAARVNTGVESKVEIDVSVAASKEFKEIPYQDLPKPRNNTDFIQESVNPGTLATELYRVEYSVADGTPAFDTSPVVQRTDTPNNKPEPETATTVQRVAGANFAVWKELNYITFVPGSACQMSQSIAYIRYWSKGNASKKTPVQTAQQSTAGTDPQQKLKEEVDKASTPGTDNPAPAETQPSTRTILTVPDNRATGRRQPVPTRVPVTNPQPQPSPKSGKVISANPSGITIMGPVSGVVSDPDPTDAVWMFLFNPEELQLSSGPDYNRAETWGVSDPENSGQPLSWRSNRNRKLSFGKVLLHGYSIGKRVDTLEAGLQQLFMARDGENGSDGPPVLEFVWGKRHFGPCVIQNIQVREKGWDKGLLVNAEVSFELEQVPEWTINDGFVDVLRPGRQPTINDPVLPRGEYNQPEGDPKPPANQPGGGNPKPQITGNPDLCNQFIISSAQFQTVFKNSGRELGTVFTSKETAERLGTLYYNAFSDMEEKNPLLNKTVEKDVDPVAPGCLRRGTGFTSYIDTDPRRAVAFINGCAQRVKKSLDDWLKRESNKTCLSLRKAREAAEDEAEAKAKQAEEKKKCEPYRSNKATCTNAQLGSRLTCGGVEYRCVRTGVGTLIWSTGA